MIIFPQMPIDLYMQRLLKEGLSIAQNFHEPESDTRIHEALINGCKFSDVERLLAYGARVSDQNTEGDTAVHVAFLKCASGQILDLLLITYLRETRKNFKNKYGLSVLHIACSRPHLKIVKKLAEWNVEDVNYQIDLQSDVTTAGCTPLHMSVEYDRYEITEYLLDTCQVDFCVQNKYGSTPLHIALDRRSVQMIDLILEYDYVYENVVDDSGLTHFMAACAASSTIAVTRYLNKQKTLFGKTSLIDAQVYRDIPEYDYAGYTSLHFAAEFGRCEIMNVLLLHCICRPCIFTENYENLTPLVLAIRCGHEAIARLLFQFYKIYRKGLFSFDECEKIRKRRE